MRSVNGLVIGWVDAGIGDIVTESPSFFARFPFVLVSSIDSNTDLRRTSFGRTSLAEYPECRFLERSLVIPGPVLSEIAVSTELFQGFDEVWCSDEEPLVAKPKQLSIVAPLNLEVDTVPPLLVTWFQQSRFRLGLGDGFGLNFVTTDEQLARLIERSAVS